MTAYRVHNGRGVEKAYDDDDEARGGQRLLGTLNRLKGTNVAVMVSRVWGGQNLGKARFEHIARAAEELMASLNHQPGTGIVHDWGHGQSLGGGTSSSSSVAAASTASAPPSGTKRARAEVATATAAAQAADRRRLMAEAAERRAASFTAKARTPS